MAYGYSFERFVIYAWSLGIGTVRIGGTMNRGAFEAAMDLKPNEMMPCVTPIGYAAERRSFREGLMRKGIKADTRKPHDQLFFRDDFQTPFPVDAMGKLRDAFELVRWSPSEVNKQPWHEVAKDGSYHFYEKKDKGYEGDRTGDLQKDRRGHCNLPLRVRCGGRREDTGHRGQRSLALCCLRICTMSLPSSCEEVLP